MKSTIRGVRWIQEGKEITPSRALGIMDAAFKGRIVGNGAPVIPNKRGKAKDGQSLEEQHGKGVTGGIAGLAVSQPKTNTTGKTGPHSEFDTANLKGLITQLEAVMKLVRGSARDTVQRKAATKDAAAIRNEAFHAGRLAYEATQAVNYAHGDEMRAYLNPAK